MRLVVQAGRGRTCVIAVWIVVVPASHLCSRTLPSVHNQVLVQGHGMGTAQQDALRGESCLMLANARHHNGHCCLASEAHFICGHASATVTGAGVQSAENRCGTGQQNCLPHAKDHEHIVRVNF